MWDMFADEYLPTGAAEASEPWGRFALIKHDLSSEVEGDTVVHVTLTDDGREVEISGRGNGPIAAFCAAMSSHGVDVRVLDYHEHALSAGGDAKAAAYLECGVGGRVLWGVGIDPSIVTASLKAVVSAVNRAQRDRD